MVTLRLSVFRGHELVANVVDGPTALMGKRVVAEINISCGECHRCIEDRPRHCENRRALGIHGRDGGFAELIAVPTANLSPIPESITDDAAVFVEPLAAAMRIGEQVDLNGVDRALVVSAGKLGQLVARALLRVGCAVTIVERHPAHSAALLELGVDLWQPAIRQQPYRPDPPDPPDPQAPQDRPAGRFDLPVECTGNPGGFEIARRALRPEGTLVLKSTYNNALECNATALVVDEIRVVGSRCGPFEPAIQALAAGEIDIKPLIEACYPLAEAPAAFEHAAQPGALKVLIEI